MSASQNSSSTPKTAVCRNKDMDEWDELFIFVHRLHVCLTFNFPSIHLPRFWVGLKQMCSGRLKASGDRVCTTDNISSVSTRSHNICLSLLICPDPFAFLDDKEPAHKCWTDKISKQMPPKYHLRTITKELSVLISPYPNMKSSLHVKIKKIKIYFQLF